MKKEAAQTGGFTLPGVAGHEELTLRLAKTWGADVIRDSDGTELSPEIVEAGYDIYSTICIIREHNEFGRAHPECLQQTFLCTQPAVAAGGALVLDPMRDFFAEQFRLNDTPEALPYWQVWDRTADTLLSPDAWRYADGKVTIERPAPFHAYTVSFLAWRVWEEISMYNHVTNNWQKEHLMPIDPRLPQAQEYLYQWLENWCKSHPHTNVVRFTSMFYNFVWIWGANERCRTLFTDWGSYDFTVSTRALPSTFFQFSEGMVEKHHSTDSLPSATYWLAMFTRAFSLSRLPLKGITKPIPGLPEGMAPSPPHMALVPTSELTHQYMKSRVAWMSSGEAFLFTHQ